MPPSNPDDQDRINHILAECRFLLDLSPNLSLVQLKNDGLIFRAVCYSIVLIGEACHHLSSEVKIKNADIDWKRAYQMRNILVHQYDSIDNGVILTTVQDDIPKLINLLLTKKI